MYQSSRYQGTLDKMRRHTLGKEIEVDSEKSGWSATLPLAAPPSPSADAAAERDDRARRHTLGTLAELPATPRGGRSPPVAGAARLGAGAANKGRASARGRVAQLDDEIASGRVAPKHHEALRLLCALHDLMDAKNLRVKDVFQLRGDAAQTERVRGLEPCRGELRSVEDLSLIHI